MIFDEVVSLGIKISGDETTLDGVYQLNGVEYIVFDGVAVEDNGQFN
tara:strand:- start:11 stop:151 length:141 start_codon:yes stop_codon:yes gene_type:complete